MDILSSFSERLSELMTEHNLTPSSLAKKIGVGTSAVTRYRQGVRLPTFDNFVKMLEVFNCSADFLIGLLDFPPANVVFHSVPPFSERFRFLMSEYKMSQYALYHKTKLSYDNFNKWLKGTTRPYIDNLVKLAKAFDCSVDYLLGRVR